MPSEFSKRAKLILETRSLGDLRVSSFTLTLLDLTLLTHIQLSYEQPHMGL